jgi:hypothetical protein
MHIRTRLRSRAAALALVLVVAAAGFIVADWLSGPQPVRGAEMTHPLISDGPYAIADVVDAVGPAVVFIEVEYREVQSPRSAVPFPFFDFFPFPEGWWPFPQPSPAAAAARASSSTRAAWC